MILKGFKRKSNQKLINKLVQSREVYLSSKKIESVGVILNLNEFDDFESFRSMFNELNINQNKIKLIGFVEDAKTIGNSIELLYSEKQIGWKGNIKNDELNTFLKTNFDALISYYKQDNLALNLTTALSKSKFKIGLSKYDERLNDLILDINPKDFKLFKTELIKYLEILNKL